MMIREDLEPVIDPPVWEVLYYLPVTAGSGTGFVNDLRGTGRYIYCLFTSANFFRFDTLTSGWQLLASPPSGTVGTGTALIFDPSRGTEGYVWALISDGTAATTFQYYDVAQNTWTSRSVTNLPTAFGTDASIAHTCSAYNASGNDDFLYLIGNNASTVYRYSIAGNSWDSAAVTAPPLGAGSGCWLGWLPGWNTDYLLMVRGAGSTAMYYYSITGNSWNMFNYNPVAEAFSTGTNVVPRGLDGTKLYIERDATSRILCMDLSEGSLVPQSMMNGYVNSTARTGNRFNYVRDAYGIEWLYYATNSNYGHVRAPLRF